MRQSPWSSASGSSPLLQYETSRHHQVASVYVWRKVVRPSDLSVNGWSTGSGFQPLCLPRYPLYGQPVTALFRSARNTVLPLRHLPLFFPPLDHLLGQAVRHQVIAGKLQREGAVANSYFYAPSNARLKSASNLSKSTNDASSDLASARAASVNPARAKKA